MATARPRPQVMRLTDAAADAHQGHHGEGGAARSPACASASRTAAAPAWHTRWNMPRASSRPTRWSRTRACKLLIDPKAVLFLLGTEMDYKTDKLSAQFVFNNPNQTSACGCGESVQLTPADGASGAEAHVGVRRRLSGADDRSWRAVRRASARSTVRRMFGGAGIFADGLMIALVRRRRDLSQGRCRDACPPSSAKASARSAITTKNGKRTLDVVLAHAGAALRRARRACATGRGDALGGGARAPGAKAAQAGRRTQRRSAEAAQATLARRGLATSGSVSQITRLRPLRLAA